LPAEVAVENTSQVTEHNLVVMVEELLELVEFRVVLVMDIGLMVVVVPNLQVAQEVKMVEQEVQEL
jgi:hypothetical protein